jgi:YHYH protein
MSEKRVPFNIVVKSQFPSYIEEESPLSLEFFSEYYKSQEYYGGSIDILENLSDYNKLDTLTQYSNSTVLTSDILFSDTEITVDNTSGFPSKYGLLRIDNELITYISKTDTTFSGCLRGFCGITSFTSSNNPEELVFSESNSDDHSSGTIVENISSLFLKEFLKKIKKQVAPGFEGRDFYSTLNQSTFIKQLKDFYSSKGTDESFKILFKGLYNEEVNVLKPKDKLIRPSDARYQLTKDIIVEAISGDPNDLVNSTLFQNEYGNIQKAYAPVGKVEKIQAGLSTANYYKLSFDANYNRDISVSGSIYGDFTVHPYSRVIGNIYPGSTTIDVDSTVAFPSSGELSVIYNDGSVGVVSYRSKSLTQFFDCSSINQLILDKSPVGINTYAYGYSNNNQDELITVRITSVIKDFNLPEESYGFEAKDTILIKTLGGYYDDKISNNWAYNICPTYSVEKIEISDISDNSYVITLFDLHVFRTGDKLTFRSNSGEESESEVVDILGENIILVKGQGVLSLTTRYTVTRKPLKVNSSFFTELTYLNANVQNVYRDKEKLLISSPSIPYYSNQSLNVTDNAVVFSGTFDGSIFNISPSRDHGFYTGDAVYYTPQKQVTIQTDETGAEVESTTILSSLGSNFDEGLYFVKRVDENNIRLARSRSNLFNGDFLSTDILTSVFDNKLEPYKTQGKRLTTQNLLREVSPPINDGTIYETNPGKTGILINGVEILNYKGSDTLYYGPVEKVNVVAGGQNYDIINPPILKISDIVGTGATGHCSVIGNLKEIRLIDRGFDYTDTPIIKITGGNGENAKAEAKLKAIVHNVVFNSGVYANLVGVGTNISTIGFTTYHKFRNGEKVVYKTDGQPQILGLTTDASYNVNVVDPYTVKLHLNENDAILGINTVSLLEYGVGNHSLTSVNNKLIIDTIVVTNSGSNYENKKRTTPSSGINTASNSVFISAHGYKSGEVIKYNVDGSPISGLTTNTEYYVTKVDENSFRLSLVGLGTGNQDYYYRTKQFINFNSIGVGTHIFNYPDISVEVIGSVGVSSLPQENFKAKIQPIFRGEVTSVQLTNNGSNYGSEEVLNFYREPEISLLFGSNAQLTAVVSSEGQIAEVLVNVAGSNYNSPPNLQIIGSGRGAILTPIIENGQIKSVKVIEGGIGYGKDTTFVNVISPGLGVEFKSEIKSWTVNLFKKYQSKLSGDDGITVEGLNEDYGLQYVHLYSPRKLRETTYSSDQSGKILYSNPDLKKFGNTEIDSKDHSPIIGWAYDGNPIYGPYGYTLKTGGSVTQMKSGYKIKLSPGRPSTNIFPEEFFVEDFVYEKIDDETTLDENNGRYCVTPEFPNGVYAYFSTLNSSPDSIGVFNGYKKPIFPYLVGKNYSAKPNEFNFKKSSNQDDVDLTFTRWIRNTRYYNLTSKTSEYDYVNIPTELNQKSFIKYASPGFIENVGIITGGNNYKVGDRLVFLESDTGGYGADVRVSKILGKNVNYISVASSTISNVEFYPLGGDGKFTAFSPSPHNLYNSDIVTVSGLSTTSSLIQGSYPIGVSTGDVYILNSDIGSSTITGLVTFFNISGNFNFPSLRENDIIAIGSEQVKVLNIDNKTSRIRALRAYNNVSSAHTSTTTAYQIQRKLSINVGYKTTFDFKINREFYFDPTESLGLGLVGVGTTVAISNPGAGNTQIYIPIQTIYLPGHNLNTGDPVVYNTNTGSPIGISTNGVVFKSLQDQSLVYVSKINDYLIGISTVRLGIGTNGSFVGIASTTKNDSLLYFTGIGTGTYHSFKTVYSNVLSGSLQRNLVTVSTAQTHGLRNEDEVFIDVNPSLTTSFAVRYNDYNRRLVIDPKDFVAAGINTQTSEITISDHRFYNGQKLIHNCNGTSYGLVNNEIYYVIFVDKDKFKLARSYEESISLLPTPIKITNGFDGTLSQINPRLEVYRDSTITFSLSDNSLSVSNQSQRFPIFEFNFYTDSNFTKKFDSTQRENQFEVKKYGVVGISTDARVTLTVNKNVPEKLYYKLDLINESLATIEKKESIIDDSVFSNNQININESLYNGNYKVTSTSNSDFTYNLSVKPESSSYISSTSTISYQTTSSNASGSISELSIKNKGNNYYSLPGISTVLITENGTGAFLKAYSKSIGNIKTINIENIGFDFPSDKTLSPTTKLPQICEIETFATIDTIGVTSFGRGYTVAPKLILLDGKTKKVVPDVDLRYELGDGRVTILRNTSGINNVTPRIVSIRNSNGVGISTIRYNSANKTAAVTLSVGFSTEESFPFATNDRILIENVSVGVGSTGKGYNSENYGYEFFKILSVAENRGGIGIVTFSLEGFIKEGEVPGTFDPLNSSGKIIAEKSQPQFSVKIKPTDFFNGEPIVSIAATAMSGIVQDWDNKTGTIRISTTDKVYPGTYVRGVTSGSIGLINFVNDFDSSYNLNYYSEVRNGWENETGFLNDILQRIPDNEYYQNFSYSLKSKVAFDTWEDVVSTLNHTAGFKKFADLQMESALPFYDEQSMIVEIPSNAPDVEVIVNIDSVIDTNCFFDYDMVKENVLNIDGRIVTDEIIFNNKVLTDYSESVGNRVLLIDDISDQFNSNVRVKRFGEVARFSLEGVTSKKIVTLVRDKRYVNQRQVLILDFLKDEYFNYLNQYARVETSYDMGSFDFEIDGNEGIINFYPTNFEFNDYDVTCLFFNLTDGLSGIGSTDLGDVVKIITQSSTSSVGSTCSVISIASSFTSAKGIVNVIGNSGQHFFSEYNVIRNGSQIEFLEYGSLINDDLSFYTSGTIGTFFPYISGSNLNIDFIPYAGIGVTVNSLNIAIGNTNTSGIGTYDLQYARIKSNYISISSSPSPTQNVVGTFENTYGGAYYVLQATNKNTGHVYLSEIVSVVSDTDSYYVEYADLQTNSGLGTVGVNLSGTNTQLTFTPIPNTDVEVRVFVSLLKFEETSPLESVINLSNASIETQYGLYRSSATDLKRDFDLTYKSIPIFKKDFYTLTDIDYSTNIITLPNHFFVTGEEVVYTNPGAGTSLAIGIGTTSIAGIGTTDKLPSSVFVVKLSETQLKLSPTAADSLADPPNTFDFISGVGTHFFTARKQNSKVIIALDNIIQSPIVSTAITSSLSKNIFISDDILYFTGITSFVGGDLIRVGDEIMKIRGVGIGSTNAILVQRPWMGTEVVGHSTGSLITKVSGNYNIVGNTLNFVEAPYGNIPIGSSTNPPDQRDYVGITTRSKFHGRSFLRSAYPNSSIEAYYNNYIFDDISSEFDSTKKLFTLTSNKSNVTGFSTENAIVLINDIFQGPGLIYDYTLSESSGISSIRFTGTASSVSYDPNVGTLPKGGILVSVGSTAGFGYQPLVAAGGTAIVSVAGTIQSISIGNTGSGYRSGIQTVRVGVVTSSLETPNIFYVGIASIVNGNVIGVAITNPGIGYTSSNPPQVIFDSPLSYSNIPLIYSSSSSGNGSSATVDIVVGQGSSVIDFQLSNLGYAYKEGQTLTVAIGGTTGIPTTSNPNFREFNITIDTVYKDKFAAWSIGELAVLDDFSNEFDGARRKFQIKLNGEILSIRSSKGSKIDIKSTLLLFINSVLQIPGEAYEFEGGSVITFTEPPKIGDSMKLLFYKGTGSIDVIDRDIIETVKIGDELTIGYDSYLGQSSFLQENYRSVIDITSLNTVDTTVYFGPGNTSDETLSRPVTWCKQTEDKIVNEKEIAKDRDLYEPFIYPATNVIQTVSAGSTVIYVESVKSFFDPYNENTISLNFQNNITLSSQEDKVSAAATAVVSSAGTISNIVLSNGGSGYISAPTISIGNPLGFGISNPATTYVTSLASLVGLGTTATATASITSGIVTSVTITNPGTGYTFTNPPVVFIEPPKINIKKLSSISYQGDFGVVVGFASTSIVGVASTGIRFDFYIPPDSVLRSNAIVGSAITISGISTGDYFVLSDSNIEFQTNINSLRSNGSIVGIGTTFIDNVYQVVSATTGLKNVIGFGNVYVRQVVVNVNTTNNYDFRSRTFDSTLITFDSTIITFDAELVAQVGNFSWGKIPISPLTASESFVFYNQNGITGIKTSALVTRTNSLKYRNYKV